MSAEAQREPVNDPTELLDEIDAITSDQELLRLRVLALQARYRELEPFAERFDCYPHRDPEFGRVNIESTVRRLADTAKDMAGVRTYGLKPVRETAERIRVYPEQADIASPERGWDR
ncbi:hypothetical protein [Nocardia sp. CS682]|uniref:hypothetical protein n=1 Tax=Nocardia sp. CS682 TaxID=1047172 RepID=UPI0010757392|nr:hypothetical protein [Nocardia sp. CS682]QBS43563.1 hypothetical protein DMB37_29130 [Nocardia sp. CS682]